MWDISQRVLKNDEAGMCWICENEWVYGRSFLLKSHKHFSLQIICRKFWLQNQIYYDLFSSYID